MVDVKLKCKSFIHMGKTAQCVVEFQESDLLQLKFVTLGTLTIQLRGQEMGNYFDVRAVAVEYGENVKQNIKTGVDWLAALVKNAGEVVYEGGYIIPTARLRDFGNSVLNSLGLDI